MSGRHTHDAVFLLTSSVIITLILALAFWFFYIRLIQAPEHALRIQRMHFYTDKNLASTPRRHLRALPDDWIDGSGHMTSGWYEAVIDSSKLDTNRPLAIYIPVIQMQAEIYINGSLLGRTYLTDSQVKQVDPLARDIFRPLYVSFPGQLLLDTKSRLQIRVRAPKPGHGLIGLVYIGSDTTLRPFFENRVTARVTMVQLISASMLTIGIFMSVLWWLRRQDSIYGWFALLVYTWTLRNLLLVGYDTPLSAATEDWIALISLGWFLTFMAISIHRYMDTIPHKTEKAIFSLAITGSMALAAAFFLDFHPIVFHRIWSTFSLLLGAYTLTQLALEYRRRDDLKNPFVPASGLSILFLGFHDWLLIMGLIPRDNGLLMHFSAPVTLITFATLLLERFTEVLRQAESINLQLEIRVAEKHRELESNFKKLRQMENRQVLAEERERFMKEMHDGVGGHLISMLSMMRSGEHDPGKITRAIEAALSDLRIMIDSLDPNEHDIPALLGAMRARLEPQLARSGIKFDWQVDEIPPLPEFGPRKALQVMRIIQEAITNVINHAEATLIRIHARLEAEPGKTRNAVIDIIDNGKGFSDKARRGHGLNNMEQRASSINARLNIYSENPGTRIRLSMEYPD
ncbi:MAG TPA: hypothetical protein ENJ80_02255 [Gammaproteobacteria bacterium]|nr:hypothetical protein [Gammaproteobacteria bacterium]